MFLFMFLFKPSKNCEISKKHISDDPPATSFFVASSIEALNHHYQHIHNRRMAIFHSLITLILICVFTASKELESQFNQGRGANRRLKAGGHRRKRVAHKQSHPPVPPNNTSSSSRIVGGSPAGAGSYPFIVSLFSVNDPTGLLPVCGM
jgi:hypothetical protein